MTWMISGSVILRSLHLFGRIGISLGDKFMGIPVGFPHLICFHLFFHPLPISGFLITFVGPSPYPVVRSQQFGVRNNRREWRQFIQFMSHLSFTRMNPVVVGGAITILKYMKVTGKDDPIYYGKLKMFETTNQSTYAYFTSSTAQGGGGSFKNRKPIGEIGCCESGMAERIH